MAFDDFLTEFWTWLIIVNGNYIRLFSNQLFFRLFSVNYCKWHQYNVIARMFRTGRPLRSADFAR